VAALPAADGAIPGTAAPSLSASLCSGSCFGRSWWGSFLVIASTVLLTLLLAPEAYIAIGLAFALLLLAALVATIAGRTRSVDRAAHPLAT
jgi:hypothetical protein